MENNTFNYTYSAKEQAEVEKIRKKYMPAEQDKLAYVRKLDRSVANKATTWSLVIGIIGALIMGTGMSLCMVASKSFMVLGIVIGVIGMGIVAVAYPVYTRILKKEREKIAPEILRLTEEIMN
jgi:uncharacterized membrane protein YeaQ/YmgE (transglycosylase-associated protein family)